MLLGIKKNSVIGVEALMFREGLNRSRAEIIRGSSSPGYLKTTYLFRGQLRQ
jgi:hypothetical protein